MDKNDPVEFLRSRWLGGRGTKVLYFAILLCVVGTLLLGQSVNAARSEAGRVEEEKAAVVKAAVQLASEVSLMCKEDGFRAGHLAACARADEILRDPSKAKVGGSGGLSEVVDATGGWK